MRTCKHCNKQVSDSHYCEVAGKTIDYTEDENHGDFLTSAMLGYATNNAIIGGLLGGNMAGGIAGDMMNGGGLFGS